MTWFRIRRWLMISPGRHWYCPACKRQWFVYANAHRHAVGRRMPCRDAASRSAQ